MVVNTAEHDYKDIHTYQNDVNNPPTKTLPEVGSISNDGYSTVDYVTSESPVVPSTGAPYENV